jgi:branched-chain amino acid transport system ATP-binding protein
MAAVTLLEARGLVRHFGGLKAVDGVDFDLAQGEIHALIGPNGAGKTTFVGLLSGRVPVQAGTIRFAGRDITRLPAHRRVRQGIAYTFQITQLFARLTVFDNVALAVQGRGGAGALADRAQAALARVGLQDRAGQVAGTLSYGHQRLLEIAMGLALAPRLLILDEPTQGLAAGEIEEFKHLVVTLAPETTVLLIEHNMDVVMDLAHRITVLNFGRVLASGTPAQVRADPAVQAAYLGPAAKAANSGPAAPAANPGT